VTQELQAQAEAPIAEAPTATEVSNTSAQVYAVSKALKEAFDKWLSVDGDTNPRVTVEGKGLINLKTRKGAWLSFESEGAEAPAIAQLAQHAANLRRANDARMIGSKGGTVFSHIRYMATNDHNNKHFIVAEAVFAGIAKGKGAQHNTVTGTEAQAEALTPEQAEAEARVAYVKAEGAVFAAYNALEALLPQDTASRLARAEAKAEALKTQAEAAAGVVEALKAQAEAEAEEAALEAEVKAEEEALKAEARRRVLARRAEAKAQAEAEGKGAEGLTEAEGKGKGK